MVDPACQLSIQVPTSVESHVPVTSFCPAEFVVPKFVDELVAPFWLAVPVTAVFIGPVMSSEKLSPAAKGWPGAVTFVRVAVVCVGRPAGGCVCVPAGAAVAAGIGQNILQTVLPLLRGEVPTMWHCEFRYS